MAKGRPSMHMKTILPALVLATTTALAHEPVEWNDATYKVVLDAGEVDGRSGMFRVETHQPGGPPMHIHDDADEYFYVLRGTVRFQVDGKTLRLEPDAVAFVPRGAEHSYRVETEAGGEMLTIMVPGGFERFFEAVAAEDLVVPEDMPRISEIADRFQLRFTGPPLPPR